MSGAFYFISYSRVDGQEIVLTLGDRLAAGPPSIQVWLDRRNLQPGIDWDEQLVEALRVCEGASAESAGRESGWPCARKNRAENRLVQ